MKKLLLALTLIAITAQITPKWRRHDAPLFGPILNTAEAVVESPRHLVDSDYDDSEYYSNRRHRHHKHNKRNRGTKEVRRTVIKKTYKK